MTHTSSSRTSITCSSAVRYSLFGALTYWFPKVTGRMLSEKLGQISFWLFFVGFNVTFFPCT
ncbi:cbb3-type cytochrome c oxidase subunit I [Terriglobus sp.]|uniref:cbb3-type cytochrome c oxidase subunit I n=1 Tax=Terriglobus sp. TaxID=1889013 RepID=UPI003AFFE1C0